MGDVQQSSSEQSQVKIIRSRLTTSEEITEMLLREVVLARHSPRVFLPKPVPRVLLEESLELARHAPSDSNTQMWRLWIVRGDAMEPFRQELFTVASNDPGVKYADLPADYTPYRMRLAKKVYGDGFGVSRGKQRDIVLLNYKFFDAPVAIIVCMSKEWEGEAALSVGMYLQTLMLALAERGVATIAQAAIVRYPDVVKKHLGIPDDMKVLLGMSVGYEDPNASANQVEIEREPYSVTTTFVE
ncbi:oxidoreductase [Xylaria sp. CBS 124048]|nr:oxidoreductase [Xylaria sp. CBS 124048]